MNQEIYSEIKKRKKKINKKGGVAAVIKEEDYCWFIDSVLSLPSQSGVFFLANVINTYTLVPCAN